MKLEGNGWIFLADYVQPQLQAVHHQATPQPPKKVVFFPLGKIGDPVVTWFQKAIQHRSGEPAAAGP